MLPAWFVPGPTLPWLDEVESRPDFMLLPVVCDEVVDVAALCFLWCFACAASGTAARVAATRVAMASWVFFMDPISIRLNSTPPNPAATSQFLPGDQALLFDSDGAREGAMQQRQAGACMGTAPGCDTGLGNGRKVIIIMTAPRPITHEPT